MEIENKLRGDSVTRGDARTAGEDHLALSALRKKKKEGGREGRVGGEEAKLFLNRLDMWDPGGLSTRSPSHPLVAATVHRHPPGR